MKKILFLCTGNSCRSQIAEGLANSIFDSNYKIESAGTEIHGVNPNAIKTLKEINIDISSYRSKSISLNQLNRFDLVITLCGDAKDKCPALDYGIKHVHWDLRDPAKFKGTELEIASHFRNTRTLILKKIIKLKIKLERGSLK
tara:strand:+ start:3009 stop:3437 length:429 start_codon:yes stop_codon:yes gene_type:complete